MEWSSVLLSLAGIIFGGGMIGELFIFFVKRCDKKKEKMQEFYIIIYKKLCEYHSVLEEVRFKFNIEIYQHVKLTESSNIAIDNNLAKIDNLAKSIKSYKRKCKKNGKPDNEVCDKCCSERRLIIELYNTYQRLLQESHTRMDAIKNYWRDNYEYTFSTIAPYSNIENYVYAKNGCDIKVQNIVRKIDIATNEIRGCLSSKSLSIWDFNNKIIIQLVNINNALQLISRKL